MNWSIVKYDLYYEEGYTLREVVKILNLSHQAVDESLKEAIKRIKKLNSNFFFQNTLTKAS